MKREKKPWEWGWPEKVMAGISIVICYTVVLIGAPFVILMSVIGFLALVVGLAKWLWELI